MVDVTLKAVQQNFDLDTPEGKLMFNLLGSLGELKSDNRSKETHKDVLNIVKYQPYKLNR